MFYYCFSRLGRRQKNSQSRSSGTHAGELRRTLKRTRDAPRCENIAPRLPRRPLTGRLVFPLAATAERRVDPSHQQPQFQVAKFVEDLSDPFVNFGWPALSFFQVSAE